MSDALKAAIADVEARLVAVAEEMGRYDHNDRTWHDRNRRALLLQADALKATYKARISDSWNGARVNILGITSTSTSGLSGAFTNWLAAARRRVDPAEALS